MVERILQIIFCHLIGDFVFQTDYIAKEKEKSWYHLLVHCFLYAVPYYICFGYDHRLLVLLASHILIDPWKARWGKLNLTQDQALHYIAAFGIYFVYGW